MFKNLIWNNISFFNLVLLLSLVQPQTITILELSWVNMIYYCDRLWFALILWTYHKPSNEYTTLSFLFYKFYPYSNNIRSNCNLISNKVCIKNLRIYMKKCLWTKSPNNRLVKWGPPKLVCAPKSIHNLMFILWVVLMCLDNVPL